MQKSKLKSKVDGPPLARVKKQHSFQKPVSKCTYQPICVCVCVCVSRQLSMMRAAPAKVNCESIDNLTCGEYIMLPFRT